MKTKPAHCTEEMLTYLDELRESGETNMFGGAAYVQREFGLDRSEARDVLIYWMDTFSERKAETGTEP